MHDQAQSGERGSGDLVDEIAARLDEALADQNDVLFAYLFGSVVKGTARPGSDVDVAVYLRDGEDGDGAESDATPGERSENASAATRALQLEGDLERRIGRPVQVVVLNAAPLDLAHNVLRHGRPIQCRAAEARTRFYVAHARRYYDMEPARAIFGRARARRIAEGRFGGGRGNGT